MPETATGEASSTALRTAVIGDDVAAGPGKDEPAPAP